MIMRAESDYRDTCCAFLAVGFFNSVWRWGRGGWSLSRGSGDTVTSLPTAFQAGLVSNLLFSSFETRCAAAPDLENIIRRHDCSIIVVLERCSPRENDKARRDNNVVSCIISYAAYNTIFSLLYDTILLLLYNNIIIIIII